MKQLINNVKLIAILILTVSFLGCTNDDSKYPKVVAGFTYTVNPATGTVTFINISENARDYQWDFGDGETSTEINPVNSYFAGTYRIVLTAVNPAGASDSIDNEITIIIPTTPCSAETVESVAAATLNMTFKTEPAAGTIISDGADFAWVSNPSFDNALNSSCKVGKITKLGNNPWDNTQINLDAKLDLNANGGLKVKVYSAKAGFKVRIKLEEIGNPSNNTELEVVTTKTSAWEELTFPFAATQTNKFNKIVLFFDLNENNKDTYYFDDLKIFTRTDGGGVTPTPFDDGLLTNGNFESGSIPWIIGVGADPAPIKTVNGNTYYSVNVTAAGNSYDVNVSQKLTIVQGATYTLTFDAWSDRARSIIAGIGLSGGDFSNTVQTVNITTTRTTYSITVAATNFGASDARVLFDLGAAIGEVNIDNVSLFLQGSGGGGSGGSGSGSVIFNFENTINYFNAFEGATVANIANPQPIGNSSSRVMELVKPSGTPFYAGINSDQLLNAPVIDLSKGRIFKVKIWSPKGNVKIRMRLEQEPGVIQPPAYEIFQTLVTANEWVTLTFDFTSQAQSGYSYTRLVLNTDWDNAGTGDKYYIDDISQQ